MAVGLLVFAVGFGLRVALQPLLGGEFAFMFFIPTIGVAAWLQGRGAGLVATAMSTLVVWFLWLPERLSFRLSDVSSALHLVAFAAIGVAVAYFIGEVRRGMAIVTAARASEAAVRKDYEVTLRSIGDAVIATDAEGRVTFMNAAAERLTDCPFAEARGREVEAVFQIVNEATREPRASSARRVLNEKRTLGFENHHVLRGRFGAEVPIAESAAPIFADDGTLRGAVLVFHDLVEQTNARRALHAANTVLAQQVADLRHLHALSAKVCGTSDLQPMFDEVLRAAMEVNRTGKALLLLAVPGRNGMRVAASCGFRAEFLERVQFVAAGFGACGSCYLRRSRVVVEDVATDSLFADCRDVAAAGEFRAVHSTPLITRDGNLLGVLSVQFTEPHRPTEREMNLMDVYARTAADMIENAQLREQLRRELDVRRAGAEELRIANERFKLATDGGTIVLFEQDRELRYRWLYPSDSQRAAAIGKNDEELFGPGAAAAIVALKRDVLASGEVRRGEVFAPWTEGGRYFDLTISPKRNGEGAIDGVAGAALDITARKEAEAEVVAAKEELARINQELEERVRERTATLTELLAQMESFSYSVSHDLRSPLRAISGFAAALKEDHATILSSDARDLLERIIRGSQRMNHLVSDVLSYTRISRDQLELAPVSLGDCLRQVMQNAPELQPPRAVISVQRDLPCVLGNDSFLTQALANILGNAVKFVPAGRLPCVEITAEFRGPRVRLSIRDNGIGIKPEHQGRLFGLFDRLDIDKRYEGTGMGLAIVRRAVERMGGAVGVISDGATGTLVWIELRSAAETEERDPGESPPSRARNVAPSFEEFAPTLMRELRAERGHQKCD